MSIPGMSAETHTITSLIVKLLNINKFRNAKWFLSRTVYRDSKHQMIYAGTKDQDTPWIDITTLVEEYLFWQEDPKRAMDFISDPRNNRRYVGLMMCKHILEHGSILACKRKSLN